MPNKRHFVDTGPSRRILLRGCFLALDPKHSHLHADHPKSPSHSISKDSAGFWNPFRLVSSRPDRPLICLQQYKNHVVVAAVSPALNYIIVANRPANNSNAVKVLYIESAAKLRCNETTPALQGRIHHHGYGQTGRQEDRNHGCFSGTRKRPSPVLFPSPPVREMEGMPRHKENINPPFSGQRVRRSLSRRE